MRPFIPTHRTQGQQIRPAHARAIARKTGRNILIGFLTTLLALAAMTGVALADKGGHKNGSNHEKATHEKAMGFNNHNPSPVRINDHDRGKIQAYINETYRKKCPPGLAKKRNGCQPPGQNKKYQVGQVLPGDVFFAAPPGGLLDILAPPPRGYRYVAVDNDILLIGEASKKIIDAVTLLSAVGD